MGRKTNKNIKVYSNYTMNASIVLQLQNSIIVYKFNCL